MKVKMLMHVYGTVDGVKMGPYYLGQLYELDKERAEIFIGSKMAEEVVPPKPAVKAK